VCEDLVCLFPTAAWGCVCVLQCSVSESGVMSLCRARSGTFTVPPYWVPLLVLETGWLVPILADPACQNDSCAYAENFETACLPSCASMYFHSTGVRGIAK
jgi:hypothetical protein